MKHESAKWKLFLAEKKWEQELKQTLHQIPSETNDAHLQATISLVKRETCLKQGRERISFSRFLTKQIRFIGWKLWALQGSSLLFISILLSRFFESPFTPRQAIKLFSCLSILLFMSMLPLLYRSVRYRMQEIEAVARFSGLKLLFSRLIIIGIGDVCLLAGIFGCAMLKTVMPADSAAFCLCFPFLLAGSGCLYLLGRLAPKQFFAGSLLYCSALMLIFSILPGQDAILYQSSLSALRAILCALLLTFCVQQLRYLTKISSYYEEMQLG